MIACRAGRPRWLRRDNGQHCLLIKGEAPETQTLYPQQEGGMRHPTTYSRLLLLVLVALLFPVTAMAQSRIAVVIGNDRYRHVAKLKSAARDADAVGAALRRLGFEVFAHTNLDRRGMNQAIGELADRIARGGVGVLFFAGHGVQMGGENFLLP